MKKIIKFILLKIKFSRKVKFDFSVSISNNSCFEGFNYLGKNVHFSGLLGLGSYVGNNSSIIGKIGRFTSIAPFVHINPGRHPFLEPYVSTNPMFYSTRLQNGYSFVNEQKFDEILFADDKNKYSVIIGNDCWIGQDVFISGGVNIGDGAIVLAKSVVTKNVPPYAIVGGIPCKILKFRYDQETINFLLATKWWEKDVSWFKENVNLFSDITSFKKYFKNV